MSQTHPNRLVKDVIDNLPGCLSVSEMTDCQVLIEAMGDMASKAAKQHEAHKAKLKDALDAKPQCHDSIIDHAESMRFWHDMGSSLTIAMERLAG